MDAALAAITDAGLEVKDIDGVTTSPEHPVAGAGAVDGLEIVSPWFMINALKLNPSWSDLAGYLVAQSFVQAVNAVAAGACRFALVFRALHNPTGRYGRINPSVVRGGEQWSFPYGLTGPVRPAQQLRRYVHKYGGTKEQLGKFVVRNREHGLKNPNSYWRQHSPEHLTLDDYMNARPISEPLGMLDCDLPVQGAGAFVITSVDRAKSLVQRPAYVLGSTVCPEFFSPVFFSPRVEEEIDVARRMGKHLYANAGITVKDVDVANLYDGYTPMVAYFADAMGFCPEGEGLAWIADPDVPLNTSGGNQGCGRIQGVPHLMDSAMQVMGRSGERQVAGANIALACVGTPMESVSLVFSSEAH
ncbi:thiolase family protein [Mesorhizobium sp. M1338]|uniref:thiolase family protein n=1 Tax=Mesorhizobium sp. M1338 TaxID=2957085 RepID=UPI00333A3E12